MQQEYVFQFIINTLNAFLNFYIIVYCITIDCFTLNYTKILRTISLISLITFWTAFHSTLFLQLQLYLGCIYPRQIFIKLFLFPCECCTMHPGPYKTTHSYRIMTLRKRIMRLFASSFLLIIIIIIIKCQRNEPICPREGQRVSHIFRRCPIKLSLVGLVLRIQFHTQPSAAPSRPRWGKKETHNWLKSALVTLDALGTICLRSAICSRARTVSLASWPPVTRQRQNTWRLRTETHSSINHTMKDMFMCRVQFDSPASWGRRRYRERCQRV